MTTQAILISFKVKIHLYNGNIAEAEGFAVVKTDKPLPLSEETVLATISLANLLRRIVITNGYTITNGKLMKLGVLPKTLEQKV